MKPSFVFYDSLVVDLGIGIDLRDITSELDGIVKRSKVANGVIYATVVGSTGSITTIEYEPGVVTDLKDAIERLVPQGFEYAHEKAWHDGNGHSHVQAALIGPSLAVAVRNGNLRLGTWQQVAAINHDNRPRHRPIEVTVTGTVE